MSEAESLPSDLPITSWVSAAKSNPTTHRNRQVTHILLSAIGLTSDLREAMLLKGGALMMLGYNSPRATQDVDFTVVADPEPFASELESRLNPALRRAAVALGYPGLLCRIQTIKKRPKPAVFEAAIGPALSITVAHAQQGTPEEKRFAGGQALGVLQVDLSFREPVFHVAEARLEKSDVTIRTYALEEVIAEKFRALLQQPERNRARRQDVYDLAWLSREAGPAIDAEMRARILTALLQKSAARGINPIAASIDNPDVAERASREWETLGAELPTKLPPFDQAFSAVRTLYLSLPW